MTINEEMEEEDGTRFYQCQPQSLTYGDQFSNKNKIFQVRIAGGVRQCMTGFFPIRDFRLMCKNPGEGGLGMDLKTELRDMVLMNNYDF